MMVIGPKIKINDNIINDFIILTEEGYNLNDMLSLHRIDSPGLTSCLANAKKVMSSL